VNSPEVAILGISRGRMERSSRTASSSRASCCRCRSPTTTARIDGADGARFVRFIAEVFEQPFLLSLQG